MNLKTLSAAALVAVALLTPAASPAQIPQPSPAGRAPAQAAAPKKFTCPRYIPATVATPAGYSRIDGNGAQLQLTLVTIQDGEMVCLYGSYAYTLPAAKNCVRAGGFWNQDGVCPTVMGGVVPGVDPTCYVTCQ